ncbi:MAG: DUF5714 domain-containing protein [Trichloromonas sp.]|jgi:MoaA/NifB/PqqE/SkfB family radical SAM enzyme/SAM-dependent methyltransferase|nr:DUF5714 domain-containing protein [Trichloromonas sp.]
MTFDPSRWLRLPLADGALWLCPDPPCWFVPTEAGDRLLTEITAASAPPAHDPPDFPRARFLRRLPEAAAPPYPGRAALLPSPSGPRELWLHVTDRCNLACGHCLFSSAPDSRRELPLARLREHLREAYRLGCRRFALTGGEPLLHGDFPELIEELLALPETRIVILSNGLLAEKRLLRHWPRRRISLQISVDGRPEHHDRLRGENSFARLGEQLHWLRQAGWRFSLSCCPTRENAAGLPWLVDFAAGRGAASLHFMWHFLRGRGDRAQHLDPLALLDPVLAACREAEKRGLPIDNLEDLKGRIFAPPGTVRDGTNAAWESAAIGPDDRLYPTAASIGLDELATPLDQGLARAWRESPVLARVRHASAAKLDDPWRLLLGGGDLDHSYHHRGTFLGDDPYQPLHEGLALDLIGRAAARLPAPQGPALLLKMGELLVSCAPHGPVVLGHGNCLLAVDDFGDGRDQVGRYYASATADEHEEILNPVHYAQELLEHIPAAYRFRGYGCGSPVMDAGVKPGERLVDLGCGSGVECFIAARLVGEKGRVTGVDMLEPMLDLARRGAVDVRRNLGYDNLAFVRGYLEEIPLPDGETDLVVSNCVLNLSLDKRRTFAEIFRILAPGGRLTAADVVCEQEPSAAIRNDPTLRGECIAGALTQKDLLGILEESGFTGFQVIKRLPYREVQGHPFFSLTFSVRRPAAVTGQARILYPGPGAALLTAGGQWLRPGQVETLASDEAERLGDQVWQLDEQGWVSNVAMTSGGNCCIPPEAQGQAQALAERHAGGCLVCGAPLVYQAVERQATCHYCGLDLAANACCEQGHFVCDRCHVGDRLELIEHLCASAAETDAVALLQRLRRHPEIPLHGPEHHALVPGVLLAVLRNAGHPVSAEQLHSAIRRGGGISGGSCGYLGICGAASGVGAAFGVLLEATPLKARARRQVQQIVQRILGEIADYEAGRCCQRDGWIALRGAVAIAGELWHLDLPEVAPFACAQMADNRECLGAPCPLWPLHRVAAMNPAERERVEG